ncbi:MAG: hypothetical protein NWF09_00640 [Candidatus Bathyarchaeota archaeon]|nr:hypothetical protein [Candidatus Bathyarchaeota archaeon]
MHRLRLSRRGQFTIIAAMLIAVVLIAAVMTTYSAIRYTEFEEQPRILSAVDEINLALKHVLGFTVGYYGSVLQVTGNTTYAKELALNYLRSGLENIGDIRPEWSPSFSITDFDLRTYWFTNASYSSGYFSVNYDLNGLGIYDMTYSTSCGLDVEVLPSSGNQAHIRITKDDGEPVINLGKQSLKFYRYRYSNLTWEHVSPSEEPIIYADGTYEITVPPEIDPASYVIRVEDSRGIIVVAASFSQYIINLDWNSPNATQTPYYVEGITEVMGDSLNFTAQQNTDDIFDMLTEAASGTAPQNYYPDYWKGLGSTTYESGTIADLQSDNGQYMQLHSTIGYSYIGSSTQNIENNIVGSQFNVLGHGEVQSITAYIDLSSGASNRKVKGAIYTSSHSFVADTQEQTVNSDGWVTFNFPDPKPTLTAGASYILVVWADSKSGSVSVPYDIGSSNQGHRVDRTYGSWPSSPSFTHENRKYSIYCTYSPVGQYACEVEFTGIADTQNWTQLTWTVDARSTTSDVNLTLQLYNFATGQYSTSGDGFMTDTVGNTTDLLKTQTITVNPTDFRNSSGYWKIKITAVKSTSTPFYMKFDLVRFSPYVTNYAIELEEQWANVNATTPRYDLCIKTGTLGSEPLKVEVRSGSSWVPIINALQPNMWNNVSVTQHISSPTFTIRFKGGNDNTDPIQDNWYIEAVLLKPKPDPSFLLATLEESTIVVELLQNGTMRWLGQALRNTTQTLPIPPIPVKAIHVNQTRNGVEEEVPFQVEDWASEYRVPQGLTNNATVFSNRQMIVFLVDVHVTKITLWWDGRDEANQTSLAYNNTYFTGDDPNNNRLENGKIRLKIGSFSVNSIVIGTSTNSTANFMRINGENSVYGAGAAYVIHHGVVRDIIQQEAEWSDGADNCPNLYANIVITLPANVTYYTYNLRLMFIDSAQSRVITELRPISFTVSPSSPTAMTENGTLSGFPIVTNGNGTFYNYTSGGWTPHHWSQLIAGSRGAGIMFTDSANQMLYVFNSIAGSSVGAIRITESNKNIELLPVASGSVSFTYALDVSWHGAVVTFDGTTPIYRSSDESGLWLLVEYPPAVTVTTTG